MCRRGKSGQLAGNVVGAQSMDQVEKPDLVGLTAEIVSAYVSNNAIGREDLPAIISDVHEALSRASQRTGVGDREELKPAVALKKSVTPDYIVCLEDGKKFKSLKRHLRTHYNLSPEEYREKWGLPHDYPMVAPNYAAARSQLAKQMGLGTRKEK
jgi:predicted transcriptional regulator